MPTIDRNLSSGPVERNNYPFFEVLGPSGMTQKYILQQGPIYGGQHCLAMHHDMDPFGKATLNGLRNTASVLKG